MDRVKRSIRLVCMLLVFGILGSVLLVVRSLLKAPRPLADGFTEKPLLYRWTNKQIAYKVFGTVDAPPLVVLHDPIPGASSSEFSRLVDALSEDYRVYTPDLPGFGLSDRPRMSYQFETYTTFCGDFLRDIVARPACIIATGLSCTFAVEVAAREPALCSRLVLMSPSAVFELPRQRRWLTPALQQPLIGLWLYTLLTTPPFLRYFITGQRHQSARAITADELAAYEVQTHQPGAQYPVLARLSGDLQGDVAAQFAALRQPVLLLWGVQAVSNARLLTGWQPFSEHVQVALVRDAGMRVYAEQPRQTIAYIQQWLSGPPALHEASFPAALVETPADHETMRSVEADPGSAPAEKTVGTADVAVLPEVMDDHAEQVTPTSPELSAESIVETASQETRSAVTGAEQKGTAITEPSRGRPDVQKKEQNPDVQKKEQNEEAYCVRCRKKRQMRNVKKVTTKNGRSALEGICPVCGTKLFRFTR